jgi:hypothetical protein
MSLGTPFCSEESDESTASQPDFPVNRLALRVSGKENPMLAFFGPNSRVSFARLDRDGSCWRTCQASYLSTEGESLAEFSGTFPRQGTMRNGVCYRQQPWVRRTEGTESSLWPTSQAYDAENPHPPRLKNDRQTRDPNMPGSYRGDLKDVVMFPTLTDSSKGGGSSRSGTRINETPTLQGMARKGLWPTPQSRDWKGQSQRGEHAPNDCLPNAVKWPTPRTEDSQCAGGHRGTDDTLYGAVCKPKDGQTEAPGQLNAEFVEWLMNFPKGWTDIGGAPNGPECHESSLDKPTASTD